MKNEYQLSQEELVKIERYLSKQLSATEQEEFSRNLSENPLFAAEVRKTELLFIGIKESALENSLSEFQKEIFVRKAKAPVRYMFRMNGWIAAASILIIVSAGIIWFVNRPTRSEELFATYFDADPGLMTTMGTTEDYQFNRAMVDYKTGNYEAAIAAWKNLQTPSAKNDTLNYFSGVAFLAEAKADSAVLLLSSVAKDSTSPFRSDANWYLGLALIKEGRNDEAIEFLKQSGHPDKDKLISSLNKK